MQYLKRKLFLMGKTYELSKTELIIHLKHIYSFWNGNLIADYLVLWLLGSAGDSGSHP